MPLLLFLKKQFNAHRIHTTEISMILCIIIILLPPLFLEKKFTLQNFNQLVKK